MPKVQVTKTYFKSVCESMQMEGDVTDFESEVTMLLAFFSSLLSGKISCSWIQRPNWILTYPLTFQHPCSLMSITICNSGSISVSSWHTLAVMLQGKHFSVVLVGT